MCSARCPRSCWTTSCPGWRTATWLRCCASSAASADAGRDLRQFAQEAVEHLRSLLLLQVAPDAQLVEATPERLAALTAQSARMGRVELLRTVELLGDCQTQMRRGNVRLPLEIALAKAALPESGGDAAALAARIDRLERRATADRPPRRLSRRPPAPATPPPPLRSTPLPPLPRGAGRTRRLEPRCPRCLRPGGSGRCCPRPGDSGRRPAPAEPQVSDVSDAPGEIDPSPVEVAAPAAPAAVPIAMPDSGDAVDLAAVQRVWEAVVETVKRHSMRLSSLVGAGSPSAAAGGRRDARVPVPVPCRPVRRPRQPGRDRGGADAGAGSRDDGAVRRRRGRARRRGARKHRGQGRDGRRGRGSRRRLCPTPTRHTDWRCRPCSSGLGAVLVDDD